MEVEATLSFLRRHAPPVPGDLLDVGCGEGTIAAALQQVGYAVVAVDAEESAVAVARRRGLDARVAIWPEFHGGPFDGVLFVRSLHHVEALDAGLARAAELLRPGGRLLVDDFAWDEVDAPTMAWFRSVVAGLHSRDLLDDASPHVTQMLGGEAPLETWRREHEGLHTAGALDAAVRAHFVVEEISEAPYLYGYLEEDLGSLPSGTAHTRRVRDEEVRLAARGEIVHVGRRWVARKA